MEYPILITRAKGKARKTALALMSRGVAQDRIHISPVLDIVVLQTKVPDFDVAIFTSAQGIYALPDGFQAAGRTALCVGAQTTEIAEKAGFSATCLGADVDSLLARVADYLENVQVLHIRGMHSVGNVLGTLRSMGIRADEVIIYDQQAQPLSESAKILLHREPKLLLPLYSPRSAKILLDQVPGVHRHVAICISAKVADICHQAGLTQVMVAGNPTASDMLDLICQLALTGPIEGLGKQK